MRQDANSWTYIEFRTAADVVKLDSIGCELPLTEIYYNVEQTFPKGIET